MEEKETTVADAYTNITVSRGGLGTIFIDNETRIRKETNMSSREWRREDWSQESHTLMPRLFPVLPIKEFVI